MRTIGKIRFNSFEGMIEEPEKGENIIIKVRRILDENEPIEDGATPIYTPKADGVRPETDIRTDKWAITMNAMDRVNAYKASEYLKEGLPAEPTKQETKEDIKPEPTRDN